jgi:hypothetical protein
MLDNDNTTHSNGSATSSTTQDGVGAQATTQTAQATPAAPAVPAVPADAVVLTAPTAGETAVTVDPGVVYRVAEGAAITGIAQEGGDLLVTFENGGTIRLVDYLVFTADEAIPSPALQVPEALMQTGQAEAGQPFVTIDATYLASIGVDLEAGLAAAGTPGAGAPLAPPAPGAAGGGGAGFNLYSIGAIGQGINPLDLLGDLNLGFGPPSPFEEIGETEDAGPEAFASSALPSALVVAPPPPLAVNDGVSAEEGVTQIVVGVLDNDIEAEDVTVTPEKGDIALSVNEKGEIVYTPEPGYTGIQSFDYTITNDNGSSTARVTVNISPATEVDEDGLEATGFVGQLVSFNVYGDQSTPFTGVGDNAPGDDDTTPDDNEASDHDILYGADFSADADARFAWGKAGTTSFDGEPVMAYDDAGAFSQVTNLAGEPLVWVVGPDGESIYAVTQAWYECSLTGGQTLPPTFRAMLDQQQGPDDPPSESGPDVYIKVERDDQDNPEEGLNGPNAGQPHFDVTLLKPLAHPLTAVPEDDGDSGADGQPILIDDELENGEGSGAGSAFEDNLDIHIPYTVTYADNDPNTPATTATLQGVVTINVDDDVPVVDPPEPVPAVTVTNWGAEASYNNSFGYYVVDDNGAPVDGTGYVIWGNASNANQGATYTIEGFSRDEIKFFIVDNGGRAGLTDGMVIDLNATPHVRLEDNRTWDGDGAAPSGHDDKIDPNADYDGKLYFGDGTGDSDFDDVQITWKNGDMKVHAIVDEDGLSPNGIEGGPEDIFGLGATATGVLNLNYGADGPADGTGAKPDGNANAFAFTALGDIDLTGATDTTGVPTGLLLSETDEPLYAFAVNTSGGTLGGVIFKTAEGVEALRITVTDNGEGAANRYTYDVALLQALEHEDNDTADAPDVEDNLLLSLGYRVTDGDGDSADGSMTVLVDDDTPVARDDVAGCIVEDTAGALTGNVLANDDVGADVPGTITAFTVGEATYYFDENGDLFSDADLTKPVSQPIPTEHGTLKMSSNGDYEYKPDESINHSVAEKTIGKDGTGDMAAAWAGVDVTAFDFVDFDPANPPTGTADLVTYEGRGIGVEGKGHGNQKVPGQINNGTDDYTQGLIVNLGEDASAASFKVSNLYQTEDAGETGHWYAYDGDGNLVGSAAFVLSKGNVGDVEVVTDTPFRTLVFTADPYLDGTNAGNDSSDYYLRSITYTPVPAPVQESIAYTLADADGDESTATLTVRVTDGEGPKAVVTENTDLVLEVDEAALPTGTDPGDGKVDSSGFVTFQAGTDAIVGFTFGETKDIAVDTGLEDNLAPHLVWIGTGTDTLTGYLDGEAAIRLTLTGKDPANGTVGVTATLLAAWPHDDGVTGVNGDGDNAADLTVSGIKVIATDIDGTNGTAQVSVTVDDDTPVAETDAAVAVEGGHDTDAAVSATGNLLVNDTFGADGDGDGSSNDTSTKIVDVWLDDGDAVRNGSEAMATKSGDTYTVVIAGKGTVEINAVSGDYTFTPDPNYDVKDATEIGTIGYTIQDADGDTSSALLTLTVEDTGDVVAQGETADAALGYYTVDGSVVHEQSVVTEPGSFGWSEETDSQLLANVCIDPGWFTDQEATDPAMIEADARHPATFTATIDLSGYRGGDVVLAALYKDGAEVSGTRQSLSGDTDLSYTITETGAYQIVLYGDDNTLKGDLKGCIKNAEVDAYQLTETEHVTGEWAVGGGGFGGTFAEVTTDPMEIDADAGHPARVSFTLNTFRVIGLDDAFKVTLLRDGEAVASQSVYPRFGWGSQEISFSGLTESGAYEVKVSVSDSGLFSAVGAKITNLGYTGYLYTDPVRETVRVEAPGMQWVAAVGAAGFLLDNDQPAGTEPVFLKSVDDADGNTIAVPSSGTVTIPGTYGNLLVNNDGGYTYVPTALTAPPGATDTFDYVVAQADGDEGDATLTVNVTGVQYEPTGNDDILVSVKPGEVEQIDGLGGNDHIIGDGDADTLRGGDGTDVLEGKGGNDLLIGGADSDYLDGGEGNDVLVGGTMSGGDYVDDDAPDFLIGGIGADEFVVGNGDVVMDFDDGIEGDTINLDALLDFLNAGPGEQFDVRAVDGTGTEDTVTVTSQTDETKSAVFTVNQDEMTPDELAQLIASQNPDTHGPN